MTIDLARQVLRCSRVLQDYVDDLDSVKSARAAKKRFLAIVMQGRIHVKL